MSGLGKAVTAFLGAAMLIGCLVYTGIHSLSSEQNCPKGSPPSSAALSLLNPNQKEMQLGRALCLTLDRSRFFEKERAALDERDALLKAAEAELAAARNDQRALEARVTTATPETKAAADRDLQAAVAASRAAETRATEAKRSLNELPVRKELFLFIDETRVPAKGPEVDIRSPDAGAAVVRFPLRPIEDAATEEAKTWRQILSGYTLDGTRKVELGVATLDGEAQPPRVRASLPNPLLLRVFEPGMFFVGALGLFLLTLGVAMLGWNSGLLRDGPSGTQFSLGRVQMAWWLVLALGGFIFVWLVSGQWKGVVTAGVVTLLGISAGTGVAARLVDETTPAARGGTPAPPAPSKSFWRDLVEDADGVALHRIQLIIWTTILGGIFLWTVFTKLAFPEFDTNLLLLAGIAGATYVGFKFPEK